MVRTQDSSPSVVIKSSARVLAAAVAVAGSGEGLSGLVSGVVSNLGGKGQGVVDKITGMIDKNKDGNIMDDLAGMLGGKKK